MKLGFVVAYGPFGLGKSLFEGFARTGGESFTQFCRNRAVALPQLQTRSAFQIDWHSTTLPALSRQIHYGICRIARRRRSNSTMPAATDTLSDEILPAIGIRTSKSQCLRTCSCKPAPSPPRTMTLRAA